MASPTLGTRTAGDKPKLRKKPATNESDQSLLSWWGLSWSHFFLLLIVILMWWLRSWMSEKATLHPHPQGLEIFAEGREPILDIVAVHGLDGHSNKTWEAGNRVNWLRDLLPDDLPNARIFTWGYDANTLSGRVSCQSYYNHGKTLVSDLALERRISNTTERPIIFIAHSLGGIIVKSALTHSDISRKGALEEHRSIRLSTYGIIFMGTPHQGGNGAELGTILANVARVFVDADDHLVKHLQKESEWLQQQLGQFGAISSDFVTKYAYEEYPTPIVKGVSILVVPPASAVVPGASDGESLVLHANHIEMVKFKSKKDGGYKTISGHLRIMAANAGATISSRWKEEKRLNAARLYLDELENFESFFVSMSLSEVVETERFVGREDDLSTMHKVLVADSGCRQTVVLYGLGGIGKTQLAIAYSRRHRNDYSAIFWLDAKSEASIEASYMRIAEQISRQHPSANELRAITNVSEPHEVVNAVKSWLDHPKNTRWLMIFDNYDRPKRLEENDPDAVDIRRFFPTRPHGTMIITTKTSHVHLGDQLKVEKLNNVRDSLQILADASRRQDALNDPDALAIAKRLDGLPLALATAGAYLNQVTTTFADYLRLYEESWGELHETSPAVDSYQHRLLYSTWQLSFTHIKRQNPLSANLLKLWAYFDNQDLWFELLHKGSQHNIPVLFESSRWKGTPFPFWFDAIRGKIPQVPEWFFQLANNELNFTEAMRVLCNYALADARNSSFELGSESGGYNMHSVVHSWSFHVLNRYWDTELVAIAVECVALQIPDPGKKWAIQSRLMRHVSRCGEFILNNSVNVENREWVMTSFGGLYLAQGELQKAEKMYDQAEASYKSALGLNHILTLDSVNSLGDIYTEAGRFDEALEMYRRVMVGCKKIGQLNAEICWTVVISSASIFAQLGILDGAKKLLEFAPFALEEMRSRGHETSLLSDLKLGNTYFDCGWLDKAEETYLRVVAAQDPETPLAIDTLTKLGDLYRKLQRLDQAEACYQKALTGCEKLSMSETIRAFRAMRRLGLTYRAQLRLQKAKVMFQRALLGVGKMFGPEHHYALNLIDDLDELKHVDESLYWVTPSLFGP